MVFGKSKASKNAAEDAPANNQPEEKIKKSKSFKRIRGLLKGESRKERKARKAAAKAARDAASGARSTADDEASTVFGVDVDDRSVLTSRSAAAAGFVDGMSMLDQAKANEKKAYILKVVLLLMDPETRRFELLQLEFDSLKALVSDVLAQIPISVTEDALRLQTYTGIAGKEGKEMAPAKLLATFCKGNEVLVAVPDGVAPKECARLARPILSDEKVVNMLAASGIDATGWKDDAKKKKKKSSLKKAMEASPATEQIDDTKKSKSSLTFSVLFIVFVALVMQAGHIYLSAPIKPGNTISPNTWLSKCGVLTMLPSCDNAFLYFNQEGIVTHYNAKREKTWQMGGAVCEVDDKKCEKGMRLEEDGRVFIGGSHVQYVAAFDKELSDADMSPWPFQVNPKVKVWKK